MVGLINFYFSSGMLSLFVDQPVNNNPVAVTFRNGFTTYEDVWNVCISNRLTKSSVAELEKLRFLNLSSSPDRSWMACTSTRGTIWPRPRPTTWATFSTRIRWAVCWRRCMIGLFLTWTSPIDLGVASDNASQSSKQHLPDGELSAKPGAKLHCSVQRFCSKQRSLRQSAHRHHLIRHNLHGVRMLTQHQLESIEQNLSFKCALLKLELRHRQRRRQLQRHDWHLSRKWIHDESVANYKKQFACSHKWP